MPKNVIDRLQSVVINTLGSTLQIGEIDHSTTLLGGDLNVDSISIVELIVSIEEEFSIQFQDLDLVPETFQTIGSLLRVIEDRMDEG